MIRIRVAAMLSFAFFCGISLAEETPISRAENLFIQGRQGQASAIKVLLGRFKDAQSPDEKADIANCLAWMEFKQDTSDLLSARTNALAASKLMPGDEFFRRDALAFDDLERSTPGKTPASQTKDPDSPLVSMTVPDNVRACSRSRNDFIDAMLRERARTWEEWRGLWRDALALDGGTEVFEMLTKYTVPEPAGVMASALPRLRSGRFKEARDRIRRLLSKTALNTALLSDALYIEVLIDVATDEPIAATTEFEELENLDRARALVLESAGMENFTHPARPPSMDVKIAFLLMVMQTEQLYASEIYNGVFENAADKRRFTQAAVRLQNFDIAQVRDDFRTQMASLDRRTAEQFYAFEQNSKARDEEIQKLIADQKGDARAEYNEIREQIHRLFRGLDLQQHALDKVAYSIRVIRARQHDAQVAQRLSNNQVAERLDDLVQQLASARQRNPEDWVSVKDKVERLLSWRQEQDRGEVVKVVVEVVAHVMLEAATKSAVKVMMRAAPFLVALVALE